MLDRDVVTLFQQVDDGTPVVVTPNCISVLFALFRCRSIMSVRIASPVLFGSVLALIASPVFASPQKECLNRPSFIKRKHRAMCW